MKRIYIILLLTSLISSLCSGQKNQQYCQEFVFGLINDTVDVQLKVREWTESIIEYDLKIYNKVDKQEVCKAGYAINPYINLNEGYEFETGDENDILKVRPYYTAYCSCSNELSFELRVGHKKEKATIYTTKRFLYSQFLNVPIPDNGLPQEGVRFIGVLSSK